MSELSSKLTNEWHPKKNENLLVEDVRSKSNKKVWWLCEMGHEWEAIIANRTNRASGCPYCSGKRVIKGETDLATVNPTLSKEWHPTKNEKLKPEDVKAGSDKKIWWLCDKKHEWVASISSRQNKGCPYCSGNLVIIGETDLATVNPILVKEWHPTLNGKLNPQEVTSQSHHKVWWICKRGHEWQRSVHGRANNNGCPYCSGRLAIKGQTDLLTTNPSLAREWHPEKNRSLTPEDVTCGSHKKAWWQCDKGHEWIASIYTRNKHGCPFCSGKDVIEGETDLATVNPDLAKEWHPTRNGILKPKDVTGKSNKKVWWICLENHEWRATINNRANGSNCSICRKINLGLS